MKLTKVSVACLALFAAACADRSIEPVVEAATAAPQRSASMAASDIVITEFLPNPNTNTNDSGEYFEVYNAGTTAVDLQGWTIKSKTGSSIENHLIAASLVVAPGAYALITAQWSTGFAGLAVPAPFYETNRSSFSILNSDTNEFIALIHPSLGTVDSVRLGFNASTGGQPRILKDVNGNGIPDEDNSLASNLTNWSTTAPVFYTHASGTNSGTPGTGPFSGTVQPPATKTITIAPTTVGVNETVQLTAKLFVGGVETPSTFVWSPAASPAVLEVTTTGLATGKAIGTSAVTVQAADGTVVTATITVAVGTLDVTIDNLNDVPAGFTKQARIITYKDKNGNNRPFSEVVWFPRNPAIASTDGQYITGLAVGETWIIAEGVDGARDSTIFRVFPFTDASTADYTRSNVEFGEPADGNPADDVLIRRKQFTASYNASRGGPNWVSWVVNGTHFNDAVDRCDCFTVDPQLPAAQQIHHRDYTGSGFSRGHMAMSEQRTVTFSENATSFYMTNMLPQMQANNGGPWLGLENYVNTLARTQNKEVYNIAGGIYLPGDSVFAGGRVRAPSWTWKVVVVMARGQGLAEAQSLADLEVIAIRTPNHPRTGVPGSIAGISNDWRNYVTTVDEIEAQTGYDLLALLNDAVERPVEFNDKPPVAQAGGPYSGAEGAAITFDGSASTDPDLGRGDQLEYFWSFSDGSTATGKTVSKSFADNGLYTATLRVVDAYGLEHSVSAAVTVNNVAPVLTAVSYPSGPASLGAPVSISASYSDASSADTHTLIINWGDGVSSSAPGAAGAVSATHTYAAAGLYTISVTLSDDDGGSASSAASAVLPVFDRSAGFVTGGGWFSEGKDKATLTLAAKYDADAVTPKGNLEFHLNDADFRFTSESFDWLVVTGARAVLSGTGSLKGQTGTYRFTVIITDGDVEGGDKKDRVRIRITDAAGAIVFDNDPGAPLLGTPTVQLNGGNYDIKR